MSRTQALHDATTVVATQPGNGILIAAGLTLPTDGDVGYSVGCIFIHTDGGDGTALYVNEGSNTSADFNLITVAAA